MRRAGRRCGGDGAAGWRALALLFAVLTTMAVRFRASGALTPRSSMRSASAAPTSACRSDFDCAPGIVFALPGGALAARSGERKMAVAGLALMVAGGVVTVPGESFAARIAGRLIAGAGGVVLNKAMAKMVADRRSGREIGAAVAIFANSWPVGVAAGLAMPPRSSRVTSTEVASLPWMPV